MFSVDMVGSDAFLLMGHKAQALYIQLNMRADDDGFVNPQVTVRLTNVQPADLQELVDKKFLIQFASGIVVIKHWRINNFIRKDRYKSTNYIDEKNQLYVKENMAYTLNKLKGKPIAEVPWKSEKEERSTNGRPVVNAGKDRVGEDRVGKVSKKGGVKKIAKPTLELPDWLNKQKWAEWVEYRKARRLTTTDITLKRQISFLGRFQSEHESIIEQSITNGWQGLFEPRGSASKPPTNVLKTENSSKLVQAMKDKAAKNA